MAGYIIGNHAAPDTMFTLKEEPTAFATPNSGYWGWGFYSQRMWFIEDNGTNYELFSNRYHLYPVSDGAYYVGSRALRMAGVTAYQGEFTYDDSATNTVTNALTLGHNSSGTPAASFGTGFIFEGETTTTEDTSMARIRSIWSTATHASRKASLILSVFDTAERDAITITTDGTVASIAQVATTHSVATASYIPLTLKSSDNSATNPLIRGLDSSDVSRWAIDYTGLSRFGKTSGGTYNGNIQLIMDDQLPEIRFVSGASTVLAQIYSNLAVANGYLITKVGIWDALNQSSQTAFRIDATNRRAYFGADANSAGDTTGWFNLENATTNATDNVLTVSHNSSGTPAASFGGAVVFKLESSTTTFQLAARLRWQWITATHASRAARGILSAYDTAERDCIMWEASGSVAMLGFFGTAPVVKPTALTTALTSITHTSPGTPDYAIQDLTAGGFGFVTKDEGNTVLSVVLNLQARVNGLETKLQALGLLT